LAGEGLINGRQAVLAGIPEFAGAGLFEPRVLNRGAVTVASDGDVSLDAGRLVVQGEYVQESGGRLDLDIFSTGGVAGLNYDQLAVTGKVALDGVLRITAPNPDVFGVGNTFQIITAAGGRSGVFSSIVAPTLQGNLAWALQYTPTGVVLGVIDATASGGPFDYLSQFRQSFGVNAAADLDGDGDTDGADFLLWQRSGFVAVQAPVGAAIPEPRGWSLIAVIAAAVAAGRLSIVPRHKGGQ
jgi:hypothetical protein